MCCVKVSLKVEQIVRYLGELKTRDIDIELET